MTQRVIKYRAWDKKRNRMYDVLHLHLDAPNGIWATVKGFNIIEDKDVHLRTEPEDITIMQFTGLLDKHGKEIYAGDIFEYEAWHGGPEHAMLEKSLKEQGKPLPSYKERRVILSHPYGHFITRKLDDITDMTYTGDTFYHTPATTAAREIIGNIYSNPELVDPKMIER